MPDVPVHRQAVVLETCYVMISDIPLDYIRESKSRTHMTQYLVRG